VKSRRMRWAGHVLCIKEMRNAYKILVEKPEGKTPLGRPKHTWEDNTKMDVKEIGCGLEDRVQWWACVNTIMNHYVP
jgi:hypothetical protein